jgi:hypothetical protein
MSVIIENLTDKPIWLRLNSGASLCAMPRSSVTGVADGEVADNAKLKKLAERQVIRVRLAGEESESESAPADSPRAEGHRGDRTRAGAPRRHP